MRQDNETVLTWTDDVVRAVHNWFEAGEWWSFTIYYWPRRRPVPKGKA